MTAVGGGDVRVARSSLRDPGPSSTGATGWPLTALLVLYPLWWLLGLGTLIVFVLAVPMVVHLVRRHPVFVPPGFGLWLAFLGVAVVSTAMLGANPPGTLPESAGHRVIGVVFTLAGYLAATIIVLYAGNLTEEEFPRRRLVRQLAGFFVVVVAGGLLGVVAPRFQFTSPVERLLPPSIAQNIFVQSLIHPAASQLQAVLGYVSGRPSAPFGYTNTWGNCLALLLGFFVISWLGRGSRGRRVAGAVILALAAIPIVYSLNRGLWIGLALAVGFTVVRLTLRGNLLALVGLVAGVALAVGLLTLSPLSSVIQGRLANQHSNSIRTFTTEKTLEVVRSSPLLGFGSTRAALGSSNSIAVGRGSACPRCGNAPLGSNGQLWAVLISHGYLGTVLYVGFFLRSMWAYRRDQSPIGDAGLLVLFLSLWFMLVYNALTMPLIICFLSIALLWRNSRDALEDPAEPVELESPVSPVAVGPWTGHLTGGSMRPAQQAR
jgi:hypothetical protein